MLVVLSCELDILRDMQSLDSDIFNYLAARMDLKTGVIGGDWCRVSYSGVALDLSERVGQGRRSDKVRVVSSKQVENAVGRLVDAGLLERLSQSGKGCFLMLSRVFWRSVFGLDRSDLNKVGRMLGDQLGGFSVIFSMLNNDLQYDSAFTRGGLGGEVGTTDYIHTTYQGGDKIAMSWDWKPTGADYEKALLVAGFMADKVNPVWVFEFVSYWMGHQDRLMSQNEWTARLARDMVDLLANPGLFESRRGIKAVSKEAVKAAGSPVQYEWQVLPRDDGKLASFAKRWGFSDAPPGADYQQYRARLHREVEGKLRAIGKGLS